MRGTNKIEKASRRKYMKRCVKCNGIIERQSATGRPASYCSTSCRRAAEIEIARITKRIAEYEERLNSAKRCRHNTPDGEGLRPGELIIALTEQISEDEARLKKLFESTE
jgi:hypothetical protein